MRSCLVWQHQIWPKSQTRHSGAERCLSLPELMRFQFCVWKCSVIDKLLSRRTDGRSKSKPKICGETFARAKQSVSERPFVKRFALCYRTVVCPVLSCLSVCNVRALWQNGSTDQDETWHAGRPQPRRHCVRWGPVARPSVCRLSVRSCRREPY